uniref:ATP-grasp fold RimK-type domain-containing protein n=1 Tax=viral metagenome TaxID=1070528 RepID=A0A6H1ZM37_9ZZZZ
MIYLLGRETPLPKYQETTGVKLARVGSFQFIKSLKDITICPEDILVRWGKTEYSNREWRFKIVLNKSSVINLVKDKLECSIFLLEHGVRTPIVYTRKESIPSHKFPVLRRLRFHSRGRDILRVDDRLQLNEVDGDYFVEYIYSTEEYRVHVFNNEVIRIQKKVPTRGEYWIRNVDHGYILSDTYTHDYPLEEKIIEESIKASKALGLNFGGIDVIVSEEGVPHILEANSAPRLNKYGRQLYSFIIKDFLYKEGILDDQPRIEDYPWLRWNEGIHKINLPIRIRCIIRE